MSKTISTSVRTEELSQSLSFLWLLGVCVFRCVSACFFRLCPPPRPPPVRHSVPLYARPSGPFSYATACLFLSHARVLISLSLPLGWWSARESNKGWKNLRTECAQLFVPAKSSKQSCSSFTPGPEPLQQSIRPAASDYQPFFPPFCVRRRLKIFIFCALFRCLAHPLPPPPFFLSIGIILHICMKNMFLLK